MHWSKLTTLEHELEAQTLLGANNSKNINICLVYINMFRCRDSTTRDVVCIIRNNRHAIVCLYVQIFVRYFHISNIFYCVMCMSTNLSIFTNLMSSNNFWQLLQNIWFWFPHQLFHGCKDGCAGLKLTNRNLLIYVRSMIIELNVIIFTLGHWIGLIYTI